MNIKKIIQCLNQNNPDEMRAYLLEIDPNAFSKGQILNMGLALYHHLEAALSTAPVADILAAHEKLHDPIWRRNTLLLAIKTHLKNNQPAEAEALIARLDKAYTHQGYRQLLRHYAHLGDRENYQRALKKSDRRRAPHELVRIEREFIKNYAENEGIDAALKLIDPDQLHLIQDALTAMVGEMTYTQIHQVAQKHLASAPLRFVQVHVAALANEIHQGRPSASKVAALLDGIAAIDPGQRISSTRRSIRHQAFWEVGSMLLQEGRPEDAGQVLARMPRSAARKELAKRLAAAENNPT